MDKAEKGKLGEDFCARFFEKLGFKIVVRNYHSKFGEIDLICENNKYLVFVEVKARNGNSIGLPRDAVNISKQRKILLTAQVYLSENENAKQPRFDAFEVWLSEGRVYKFKHIENAFDETALGGYNDIF